ncbi:MAG: heme exporter protein CcmB [Alphaproteobacteria bacterium]|nr:heme exporter protein CcmB [Alphaproteobacteria bacterium]
MRSLWALLHHDLRISLRQGNASTSVVVFFVLAVTLFPLGVGPEPQVLARIASGVVWAAALLAAMISLDRLFQADFEDGVLEQLCLAPTPLPAAVLAKALAHWLLTGLPLTLIAPVLAMALQMEGAGVVPLILGLALGTPVLSLVGAIGAGLTIGIRRGSVLLSLLVLPLFLPILIFGVGAVEAAINGLSARPHLLILGAMLLAAIVLAPLATAAALRANTE